MRQFLGIAREFPGENAQKFIEDQLGKKKLVSFFNDPAKRDVRPPAGENQGRHQNVGVEDDLHSSR